MAIIDKLFKYLHYSHLLVILQELWKEVEQKRRYRIGLNLFNGPKPELGVEYLARHGFLELSHVAVARFLHKRSCSDANGDGGGLAKEKVGEYLGNLQSPFAMKVLACFVQEFDFAGWLQIWCYQTHVAYFITFQALG